MANRYTLSLISVCIFIFVSHLFLVPHCSFSHPVPLYFLFGHFLSTQPLFHLYFFPSRLFLNVSFSVFFFFFLSAPLVNTDPFLPSHFLLLSFTLPNFLPPLHLTHQNRLIYLSPPPHHFHSPLPPCQHNIYPLILLPFYRPLFLVVFILSSCLLNLLPISHFPPVNTDLIFSLYFSFILFNFLFLPLPFPLFLFSLSLPFSCKHSCLHPSSLSSCQGSKVGVFVQ